MSGIIVQKYGGSSLADIEKIKHVANKIYTRIKSENARLVVVVSAMGKTTDSLLNMSKKLSANPQPREIDMLLTTGEQVSASLISIALNDLGIKSRALNAFQARIFTDSNYNVARIQNIDSENLKGLLENHDALIITGFQGIDTNGELTTLGRGGSDTSAVAMAAALNANCEIYSDVDGIYTADPKLLPGARKLKNVSYDEMLEMASLGAKVLHSRSIEMAKKHGITIYCASTFLNEEGTYVLNNINDQPAVTGLSVMDNQTLVTLSNLPDDQSLVTKIFETASKEGLNVDMISLIKNYSFNISFTVVDDHKKKLIDALNQLKKDLSDMDVNFHPGYVKVSVTGIGMRSHSGIAAKYFEAFKGIPIKLVTTSEIKMSSLIEEKYKSDAVNNLGKIFNLVNDN